MQESNEHAVVVTSKPGVRTSRVLAWTLAALWATPAVAVEPVPNSMAALGDSITVAATTCDDQLECRQNSWATGTNATVNSHYQRILAKNPQIQGRAYNFAVNGDWSAGLMDQTINAVAAEVDYITLLVGGNDACAASEAEMTPVATYAQRVGAALDLISTELPDTRIFVSSVPDLYRVWQVGRNDWFARWYWGTTGVCHSMLANPTSTKPVDERRRLRVRQRVIDYNTVLQQECSIRAHCKFDDNALFNYPFTASDLSWDWFHPGIPGQKAFAEISYQAGFDW
jgi:lysophospholipase L1-like esterase